MKSNILVAFFYLAVCSLVQSCNNEESIFPQEVVLQNTNDRNGLPPILNFDRSCQPKELIRNAASIEGYTDKESYQSGESVYFSIHSRTPEYSVAIYRFGKTQDLIYTEDRNDGKIQNYLCYAYSWGCDWETTFGYKLPSNLLSGFYSAEIKNNSNSFWISFIVKPTTKSADIALMASNNTWCAYNNWGGGSYYSLTIQEETRYSENINFARPNKSGNPFKKNHLAGAELHLMEWLESNSLNYELFAAQDLHYNAAKLRQYKVIIIQVHPEYYTSEMYSALENYVNNGGNLMYLGANGVYAKVVYNPTLRIMETRKSGTAHFYESSKGGRWRDLNRPESALLGVQYDRRGYDTYHPYKVKNEKHWIFSNTGLKKNDLFGSGCGRNGASGHETDKITEHSPKNLIHLAKGTNPDEGGADMIFYENTNGGKVFSVGSITYTSCINSDPVISQITENVIREFTK